MNPPTQPALGAPTIETTRWRLDPARSSVEFRAKTLWGLSTVRGRFSRYRGTLDLSRQPAIELTIETESLDTNRKRRDTHLRSADFFDAGSHPTMRFVSDSATLEGDHLKVRGQLHARNASLPLELDAIVRRTDDELEIDVATHADHHQLGMTWAKLMVRTPSLLSVKGRLVQDA